MFLDNTQTNSIGVFFKYVPKTGAGMRYAPLTDYAAHPPLVQEVVGLVKKKDYFV